MHLAQVSHFVLLPVCHLTPYSLQRIPGTSPPNDGVATSLRSPPPVINSQGSPLTSRAGSSPTGGVANLIYSVRSLFCQKPSTTVSYSWHGSRFPTVIAPQPPTHASCPSTVNRQPRQRCSIKPSTAGQSTATTPRPRSY